MTFPMNQARWQFWIDRGGTFTDIVAVRPDGQLVTGRHGSVRVLVGGKVVRTVPLLTAVSHASSALSAFGLMLIGLVIVSGYTSINAVVKAELFPARIRALGVGLPYALTVAIFGGTTEYVALWLKNAGHENWFFFYVAGAALISLLVYAFMGESSSRSHLERETRELQADGEFVNSVQVSGKAS